MGSHGDADNVPSEDEFAEIDGGVGPTSDDRDVEYVPVGSTHS